MSYHSVPPGLTILKASFNASVSAQHIKDMYGSNNSKDILPDYTLVNFKLNARVFSVISISLA